MKKLKMNLIFLTVISLSLNGCYDPKGKLLYKIDMKLGECRVYICTQSKPELKFELREKLAIEACNNLWGINDKDMIDMVKEWNANHQKDNHD